MQSTSIRLLMIEDNVLDVEIVRELLIDEQLLATTIEHRETLAAGIQRLENSHSPIHVALLDLSLTDAQGLKCFEQVHQSFPELPLIILSGNTDDTLALEAVQKGAQDYLVKGRFDSTLLQRSLFCAIERQKLVLELKDKTRKLLQLSEQLEKVNHNLQQLTMVDGLTQINNRRRFDQVYAKEWKRLCRVQEPLSVIMCDVDSFKAYNDTYGHLQGDNVLMQVARAIKHCLKRPADLAARYGGEEFVVLLPNTLLAGAVQVAEDIRQSVKILAIRHQHSSNADRITLSLGVASMVPSSQSRAEILLQSADQALYQAKDQGRDRVSANSSVNLS